MRILWEKSFLIARLIVGRARLLAGWWRSVDFPLRPKADLRNQLSVTSYFRLAVVYLVAKRETKTRHATPMYRTWGVLFYRIIRSTEHGTIRYSWIGNLILFLLVPAILMSLNEISLVCLYRNTISNLIYGKTISRYELISWILLNIYRNVRIVNFINFYFITFSSSYFKIINYYVISYYVTYTFVKNRFDQNTLLIHKLLILIKILYKAARKINFFLNSNLKKKNVYRY